MQVGSLLLVGADMNNTYRARQSCIGRRAPHPGTARNPAVDRPYTRLGGGGPCAIAMALEPVCRRQPSASERKAQTVRQRYQKAAGWHSFRLRFVVFGFVVRKTVVKPVERQPAEHHSVRQLATRAPAPVLFRFRFFQPHDSRFRSPPVFGVPTVLRHILRGFSESGVAWPGAFVKRVTVRSNACFAGIGSGATTHTLRFFSSPGLIVNGRLSNTTHPQIPAIRTVDAYGSQSVNAESNLLSAGDHPDRFHIRDGLQLDRSFLWDGSNACLRTLRDGETTTTPTIKEATIQILQAHIVITW